MTDPTSQLAPDQLAYLKQVAARTWAYLSGPGVDKATGLMLDSVALTHGKPAAQSPDSEYTNPALIGMFLDSIVAADDLGLISPAQAHDDAQNVLSQLQKMKKDHGFLYRWYSTADDATLSTPKGEAVEQGYVSTVDNGWLAQGLLVAKGAFSQLAPQFGTLLDGMDWGLLYDKTDNVLYNSFTEGKGYSRATYDNVYSGPRIADYMAIGSGKVPGQLWWGLQRTPPSNHRQRQVPQGSDQTYKDPQDQQSYQVFEGHYSYGAITFVPTFDGSLFQALGPNLMIPEESFAPASLGLNNLNSALAQSVYASRAAHSPVWGWAPATSPSSMKYTNYGVPDMATDQGKVLSDVVTPYAAFLALPVIPQQAYLDIRAFVRNYPSIYTDNGFLDSLDPASGQVASRYMAVSQMSILMALDDAIDHNKLQAYVASSSYGQAIQPYLKQEKFSIGAAFS